MGKFFPKCFGIGWFLLFCGVVVNLLPGGEGVEWHEIGVGNFGVVSEGGVFFGNVGGWRKGWFDPAG